MIDTPVVFQALLALHFFGLAFGLGGAFVADYSFFRTVRKADRISPETVVWMRSFSRLVWVGLIFLIISGGGMLLMDPDKYLHSDGFLFKMFLVLLLLINGLFLNFYTTARLTTFNFSKKYPLRDAAWRARKLSFVFGAISSTTWVSIVIVALFKNLIVLPFMVYLLAYVVILVGAIGGSLVLETLLFMYARSHPPAEDLNKIPLSQLSSVSSDMYRQQIARRAPQDSNQMQHLM